MVNTLINEYKKDKIHYGNFQYVESYYETDRHADVNLAISRINVAQIYELIARLPPASQQVFNLYYIDGFRHKEIAGMLKISEGTSKWHLNAAREKLKELITELQLMEKIA
jgi:RNA polymerase sigma-70 factor (ECF subfamily)